MRRFLADKFRVGTILAGLILGGFTAPLRADYPTSPQILDKHDSTSFSLMLQDYATVPKSTSSSLAQVARINFIRPEPIPALAATRLFANDLNGNLYLFNRASKTFSTYLNFATTFAGTFDNNPGLAAGLVTMQFDPDYAANGKFYTVHTELGGNPSEYREAVLYEWRDTDINNGTFGGTRAEMIRIHYTDRVHPMGDIVFNPLATSAAHPDWRNMYIASGDGGAGESNPPTRNQTQMLDNLLGKILRIQPAATGTVGTYSIPSDNPFTAAPYTGARGEIYAYGFRNPHRLNWDVDPQNPANNYLLVDDIGLASWEEVNLVKPGANYGYSRIEGNMVLGLDNEVDNTALPSSLPIHVGTTSSSVGTIVPQYPLAQYSHQEGDAVSSGFVYRGTKIPELVGKYVFGDITTGRLFYSDLAEMLAKDDGDPETLAEVHELKVFYSSPYNSNGLVERRVFDLVRDTFRRRNDTALGSVLHNGSVDSSALPGGAAVTSSDDPYGVPYGGGRADVRWALIDDELYLLSKSDGMIRLLTHTLGGDANLDGVVNIRDLFALASHWQQSAPWKDGDFDHDGFVDVDDLTILAAHWQQSSGSVSLNEALLNLGLPQNSIPEPGTCGLFGLLLFALGGRRHRSSHSFDH